MQHDQVRQADVLHVNTVKYRMNQIMEFLQCDLKDGDTFCKVHLSLKILEYKATLCKKS